MASTFVGIIKLADGTITQVVNCDNDAQLDAWPLKAGETMTKVNRSTYTAYTNMVAIASALGLKVK